MEGRAHGSTVYVMDVKEPHSGQNKHGIGLLLHLVVVQLIEGDQMHYCRLRIGGVQTISGKPFGEEKQDERLSRLCLQVASIVRDWLEYRGYRVRPGLVGFPHDVRLLEGWAKFLDYDKVQDGFVRRVDPQCEGIQVVAEGRAD